ncbi:MAG: DUF523 domain-containing protein [Eubacteriales bacterium]|nr:DUF523 domain-containing protein [Eubacteriales bacterium]
MKLVSACLAGYPCRYDGKSKPVAAVVEMVKRAHALPICPESLGGLPCPRAAAEICGGNGADVLAGTARVMTADGQDVTAAFIKGAQAVLALCRLYEADEVLLMPRSPSCGCGEIYDGSFGRVCIPGDGVCAALLRARGIRVTPWQEQGV